MTARLTALSVRAAAVAAGEAHEAHLDDAGALDDADVMAGPANVMYQRPGAGTLALRVAGRRQRGASGAGSDLSDGGGGGGGGSARRGQSTSPRRRGRLASRSESTSPTRGGRGRAGSVLSPEGGGGGGSAAAPPRTDRGPPLCTAWASGMCPKPAEACARRHYFVSLEEATSKDAVRAQDEMVVERAVFRAVSEREVCLERLRLAALEAKEEFDEHTSVVAATYDDVCDVLHAVNKLRVLSVRVVEAVAAWRVAETARRKRAAVVESGPVVRSYTVRIMVRGRQLYRGSPALVTKLKRMQVRRPHAVTALPCSACATGSFFSISFF